MKQVVTAAQQRVFARVNTDFLNASKAYEALMAKLPNPEADETGFLAFLKESKHDVTAFVKAKKGVDKVKDDVHSLVLQWEAGDKDWDKDDQAKEILDKANGMASDLESTVFLNALLSQMRTGSFAEPQGQAVRSKVFICGGRFAPVRICIASQVFWTRQKKPYSVSMTPRKNA